MDLSSVNCANLNLVMLENLVNLMNLAIQVKTSSQAPRCASCKAEKLKS